MVRTPSTIGANHQHDMCGVVAHRLKMGRKEHQGYYNDDNKRLITNQYMGKDSRERNTHKRSFMLCIISIALWIVQESL